MLAAQGAKATVKAALTSGLGPKKITAIDFTITSPSVRIGTSSFLAFLPHASQSQRLVASQSGNSFETENSALGLKHAFEDLYQDQGYAAVKVDVTQADHTITSDQSIDIPFAITIMEGGVYKLGSINYPADALVPRAEVDKSVKKPAWAREGRLICLSSLFGMRSMPRLSRLLDRDSPLHSMKPRTS